MAREREDDLLDGTVRVVDVVQEGHQGALGTAFGRSRLLGYLELPDETLHKMHQHQSEIYHFIVVLFETNNVIKNAI